MTDLTKRIKKKIFDAEPLDPSGLPIILDLCFSKKEMGWVFIVLSLWGGMDVWEGVETWVQGASFHDFGPILVLSLFLLSLAGCALIELLSTRQLTIDSNKVEYKYYTPFKQGGWEASYQEFTSLEFKRNPVKFLGFLVGHIFVVELVHPTPLQTVPLVMCSPVHETRVRERLEDLRAHFGLPLVDKTLISEKVTPGIQDWRAAARIPWLLFYGTLLFLPSSIVLGMSYYVESRLLTTEDWHQTTCTILQSELNPIPESDSEYSTHKVGVFYRYQVNGKEYESRNYSMAGNTMTEDKGQRIISQHPPGSQTICYTNPKNPAEAILDHGNQNLYTWLRVPFWIMFVGSLFLFRRGFANWRKTRKT